MKSQGKKQFSSQKLLEQISFNALPDTSLTLLDEDGATKEGIAIRLGAQDGLSGIADALTERGFLNSAGKTRFLLSQVDANRLSAETNKNPDAKSDIQLIAKQLRQAKRVLFITGAGISADSGLPTYRGVAGLYNDTVTDEGISIETALSAHVFATHPEITWKYLAQIEQNCRGTQPNPAHLAIAELEQKIPYVLILTQNVDGLHRKAGSGEIIEIHGSLHNLFCTKCNFEESVENLEGRILPVRCQKCGALVRPNVVLFDEALPLGAVGRLREAMNTGFDMVITIGTSGVFPYISQPVIQAAQSGIFTVEINPIKTKLSKHVNVHLEMGATQAMLAVMAEI